MAFCNEHFLELQGAYLFAEVRKRAEAYKKQHPDADIISLGIGDVTQPLAPAVVEAMTKAVAEMGRMETFRGSYQMAQSVIQAICRKFSVIQPLWQ